MQTSKRPTTGPGMCALVLLLGAAGAAWADNAKSDYPAMTSIDKYRMPSASDEIALARSAAPASISGDADILTLGDHGYETAVKGKNGFVCMIWRSWAADFGDAEFWNPKIRGPICLNPAAARSVLPGYLERTQWVLAGVSKPGMIERTKAAVASNAFKAPEPGAMSFMMSKQQYVADAGGHWHPHLMFFVARTDGAAWGADLVGSPIFASQSDPEPVTTFIIPVPKWSDGTPAAMQTH
ncbi:MAG TPA: hypothetical protein VNV61_11695 [Steroidobacteraceae bacterium]|nr:hypothetical protein [Steroidobacteraceae bacterium]